MSSEHVNGFMTKGILKLATAHELRKLEDEVGRRGDENELRQVWDAEGTHHLDKTHPVVTGLAGSLPPGPAPKVILQAGKNTVVNFTWDAFLYCASIEHTPELAARMKAEFDADTCVKISDFAEFVRLISLHPELASNLRRAAVAQVQYVPSKRARKFEGLNPFEKEAGDYSWQKEIRGVFEMTPTPKVSKLIAVPSVVHLLRRET